MKRIIKIITAAFAAAAVALSLAGCSDYVMTEEDLAVQKSIEGFWAADIDTGYDKFDESGNLVMVVVFEFTEDFKYFMHECYVNDRSTIMYGPVEYSFENEDFRVVTDGRVSYAKINVSDDGQTMYWITDGKTETYKRITEEKAEELGIIPYDPESDAGSEDTESGSDSSDTDKNGASAEAAAMALTPAEPDFENFLNIDFELDHSVKFDRSDITETPAVIAETEDGEIVLYGVYTDYYPLVFIEHDGVVDSFNQCWLTPRAILPQVMYEDIDGDGEKELAVSYYGGSGSGVAVMDLVIYERLEDGHFSEYHFDAVNALEKAVEYSIDSEAHTLSFRAGDKSLNSEFTDELYPEGIEEIHWGNDIEYELNDGKITLIAAPNSSWHYESMPCVTAQVVYTGDNADIEITDMSLFY